MRSIQYENNFLIGVICAVVTPDGALALPTWIPKTFAVLMGQALLRCGVPLRGESICPWKEGIRTTQRSDVSVQLSRTR